MNDRRLRFCMVTTFYPPYNFGGDGIFVHRLANELARRGHRVDVIHCKEAYRAISDGEPSSGYNDHPNVTVHGLESPWGFLSPLATQQTGRPFFKRAQLRRILDNDFDVIHFHNVSLLGPAVLGYGRGIKLYTMHEYWLVCPTHVLFRFNRAACEKPYCFACTLVHKRPPQWWRYTNLLSSALEHVDAFIAPSRFSREKHHAMGIKARIVEIPHFVPALTPCDAAAPIASTAAANPYFLFAGRLEKLKGLESLIPIFRRYAKAQLWIAGSGNEEAKLRRVAADTSNIRFLGHVGDAELAQLYAGAVALIVPSLCFETFGQVIIEAFSQKTPAIVRKSGAIAEIIEKSGGGAIYESDEELMEAMGLLLANPAQRQKLGARGYQAYWENWTADVHLQRYLSLIAELGAQRSRRSPVTTAHDVH